MFQGNPKFQYHKITNFRGLKIWGQFRKHHDVGVSYSLHVRERYSLHHRAATPSLWSGLFSCKNLKAAGVTSVCIYHVTRRQLPHLPAREPQTSRSELFLYVFPTFPILLSPGLKIISFTPPSLNPLTPNDHYTGRTAPLTSKLCILYIYSTNTGTEYFKHGIYSPFFSLQNAVCFIILTYLVPVLFTFYIQGVLKLKKIIPAPKG